MIDLNAIIRRNPDWKVNALGGQDQQDIRAMISELLFYVPKCTKCGDHLGLLAEVACPKCRLTVAAEQFEGRCLLAEEDNERLEVALRRLHSLPIDSMSYKTTLEGYAGAVRMIAYEALELAADSLAG